jgi:hypothetical protein
MCLLYFSFYSSFQHVNELLRLHYSPLSATGGSPVATLQGVDIVVIFQAPGPFPLPFTKSRFLTP